MGETYLCPLGPFDPAEPIRVPRPSRCAVVIKPLADGCEMVTEVDPKTGDVVAQLVVMAGATGSGGIDAMLEALAR